MIATGSVGGVTAVVELAPVMPRIAPAKIESRLSALSPIPSQGGAFEHYLGTGVGTMQEHRSSEETAYEAGLEGLSAGGLLSVDAAASGNDTNNLEMGGEVRGAAAMSGDCQNVGTSQARQFRQSTTASPSNNSPQIWERGTESILSQDSKQRSQNALEAACAALQDDVELSRSLLAEKNAGMAVLLVSAQCSWMDA